VFFFFFLLQRPNILNGHTVGNTYSRLSAMSVDTNTHVETAVKEVQHYAVVEVAPDIGNGTRLILWRQ